MDILTAMWFNTHFNNICVLKSRQNTKGAIKSETDCKTGSSIYQK